jgi:L-fucose isomerase-like protein
MARMTVRIGFVPSYRDFYGQAIPEWCLKMRTETLAVFQKVPGFEVVVPTPCPEDSQRMDAVCGYTPDGSVCTLDQAEVVAEYFQREKVDGIIIGALNFGDERSAAKVAEKLRLPLLLFATREPPALEGPAMARVSDSYCGTLSLASGLYRRKLPFHYAGIFFPEEADFLAEVETFVRAVAVVKALKGARIGQIGVRPPTFETVGFDETAMIQKFGQNVIYAEVSDLVERAKSFSDDDPRVTGLADRIRAEVAAITVSDAWLFKAARLELAVSEFFQKNKLSALAMQCWPSIQPLWGMSTCALFGRLTGQGMLTACETDILGALSMLVNYSAALQETVPHFIDWTIQHRQHDNRFLAWHCGNAPVCLANNPQKTALRSRQDMKGELPSDPEDATAGLYQFQIRPGQVTLCRLAEYDHQWKMLITTGEIIPSSEVLAGTWAWVEVHDHKKLYRTLIEEGFIHHASMVHGDQTQSLALACKFLDIQPILILADQDE